MVKLNVIGDEKILDSDVICIPIDYKGQLPKNIDIPLWMKERLSNMGYLNMLEAGNITVLTEENKKYCFMVIKRNLDYCLMSDIELSIYNLKKINSEYESISVPLLTQAAINPITMIGWYNAAIDRENRTIQLNLYPCSI